MSELTPQEKYQAIVSSTVKPGLIPLSGKALPSIGEWVLIGYQYSIQGSVLLTQVTKIDGRGVIHTEHGTRFSTASSPITSTKKMPDGWWGLFNLDDTYDRLLKRQAEAKEERLRGLYRNLYYKVSKLNPISDATTISKLIEVIEETQL